MDVIIQSLGFTAGEQLESFISEKLQKLDNLNQKIIRADVTLYLGPHKGESDHHAYCEIRLEMPGNDPFAKRGAASFEEAATTTIETLQQVLRKAHDKQVDQHRGRVNIEDGLA